MLKAHSIGKISNCSTLPCLDAKAESKRYSSPPGTLLVYGNFPHIKKQPRLQLGQELNLAGYFATGRMLLIWGRNQLCHLTCDSEMTYPRKSTINAFCDVKSTNRQCNI